MKNLLLINGLGSSIGIINELLSGKLADINIYLSYPLSVLTLAGWVKQELPKINIQILDLQLDLHKKINYGQNPSNFDSFINQEIKKVKYKPDYIGISMSFSNGHQTNLKVVEKCKQKWPYCQIIAGGMHATTFTPKIINNQNIDYVLRGPGDESFIILLKNLINSVNVSNIPGLVTKKEVNSSPSSFLENLDLIPFYPYDLIDMEYLVTHESTSPVVNKGSRTGLVQMSRGCIFTCAYCSSRCIHGNKVIFKSVNRVITEVENLIKRYNVNKLCIIDDLFGVDKEYFYSFFKEIDKKKLKIDIVIPAGLSLKIYDKEMINVLIDHGLEAINFPLESGCQYVQNNVIKKYINLQRAARLIKYTKKKGLFVGINIVIGSPGETIPMMYETYGFICKLPVDWTSFFIAYPYPGTEMTKILYNRGEIDDEKLISLWEVTSQGFKGRNFDTREIKGIDLSELVYNFNIQLNFFNNYNFRIKNYKNMLLKLNKVISRYPFHVVALACRAKCYQEQSKNKKALMDINRTKKLITINNKSRDMYQKYHKQIINLLKIKSVVKI